jgi:arylsulfatase A-like enzyme
MHVSAARPSARRLALLLPAGLVLGVLSLGAQPGIAAPRGVMTAPAIKPNVVLILTDDQRFDTLSGMPNVQRLLAGQGTTYTRAMVPTSLCCPSRATILTGLYAHSSRLFGNGDVGGARFGGWRKFHRLGLENRTLGPALQAAGYRTALIGKYLNYFGKFSPPGYRPPGWDTFAAFMSSHGSYYSYRLSDGTRYGQEPQDYSTDVLASRATEFISNTPVDQPLFLYFAPFGPHLPYQPAPRDVGTLDGKLTPYTAATLNQRLKGMPRWMQLRKHFTQEEVNQTRQSQLEALMSIDDGVGSIVQSLRQGNRDRDTLFIFMSDNGYFWGEHTIIGKDSPYDAATRIPMVIRWDGHTPPASTSGRIVLNVDIARTIADATGASMQTDGLDILGTQVRKGFVLEAMDGYQNRPAYCGWRTKNRMYVQWNTGETELYDYRLDPAEKTNLAHRKSWRKVRHAMRAKAMAACRPVPPHFHW